jgi:hypothetical protein
MTERADGTLEETPHDGDDDPAPQSQGSAGAEIDGVDEQLAARLIAQARAQGTSLVGPDGLLQRFTAGAWWAGSGECFFLYLQVGV